MRSRSIENIKRRDRGRRKVYTLQTLPPQMCGLPALACCQLVSSKLPLFFPSGPSACPHLLWNPCYHAQLLGLPQAGRLHSAFAPVLYTATSFPSLCRGWGLLSGHLSHHPFPKTLSPLVSLTSPSLLAYQFINMFPLQIRTLLGPFVPH